jgi:uncharacterized protein (TIGR03084 family)
VSDLSSLCDELAAEEAELDAVVASLPPASWDVATPAAGWAVRDQIAHLAMGERLAAMAASDPEGFARKLGDLLSGLDAVQRDHAVAASAGPDKLLASWRDERARLLAALRAHGASDRIPWVTGEMGARSFATSRLMETWAHGQDTLDGLGLRRAATTRLRHVADLGVRTRRFSFVNRGLEAPPDEVRVEIEGPSGDVWTWGDDAAPDRVTGSALDFCLVVTQRRHVDDTELKVEGDGAATWMAIAQAFAGPPTTTTRSA